MYIIFAAGKYHYTVAYDPITVAVFIAVNRVSIAVSIYNINYGHRARNCNPTSHLDQLKDSPVWPGWFCSALA